jgi:hypothetical protein
MNVAIMQAAKTNEREASARAVGVLRAIGWFKQQVRTVERLPSE